MRVLSVSVIDTSTPPVCSAARARLALLICERISAICHPDQCSTGTRRVWAAPLRLRVLSVPKSLLRPSSGRRSATSALKSRLLVSICCVLPRRRFVVQLQPTQRPTFCFSYFKFLFAFKTSAHTHVRACTRSQRALPNSVGTLTCCCCTARPTTGQADTQRGAQWRRRMLPALCARSAFRTLEVSRCLRFLLGK